MNKYKQLTKSERQEISILSSRGYKPIEIAREIGVHRSTIGREIQRNKRKTGEYDAKRATEKARVRRRYAKTQVRKLIKYPEMRKFVEQGLEVYKWSPEQISGRWSVENPDEPRISTVTIYKYLESMDGQNYKKYLYFESPDRKRKRRGKGGKKEMIPDRVNISKRPEDINERKNTGDAEGDLIVSPKGETSALLTVVDRKTRFLFAEKLPNRKPSGVVQKIKKIQEFYPMKSITLDNGIEFKHHKKYGCKTYFCNLYSSSEKGQIEYANRLIRRFIPKKSVISDFSDRTVQKFITLINHTPRKCLGYKTPIEARFNKVMNYTTLNPNLLKI